MMLKVIFLRELEVNGMDTLNSFETNNKIAEPKVVDTVNVFGKYVDASSFKSKVITASALLVAGVAALVIIF